LSDQLGPKRVLRDCDVGQLASWLDREAHPHGSVGALIELELALVAGPESTDSSAHERIQPVLVDLRRIYLAGTDPDGAGTVRRPSPAFSAATSNPGS
jgi:hypothetical protein